MRRSFPIPTISTVITNLLVSAGCSGDTEPIADGVAGTYRSVIFIRPNGNIGCDDAHTRGDFVEVTLLPNGMLTAKVRESEYGPPGSEHTTMCSGTYIVRNDSVFMTTTPAERALAVAFRRVNGNLDAGSPIPDWFCQELYLQRL